MFLLRFLYVQFNFLFAKIIEIIFQIVSKFAIIDMQIIAILVFFNLLFKVLKKTKTNFSLTILE